MEDHEIVYPTLAAYFYYPEGIATDGTYLYIADSGNNAIRKLLISSGAVSTIAGNPNVQPGSTDGPGTNGTTPSTALFNNPLGICYIAPKYLYIADSGNSTIRRVVDTGNSTIRKLVISSAVVSTLAGQGGVKGDVDGTGSGASFNWPEGIAIDGTGTNLYVADTLNATIRQVAIATGAVTTLAGQGGVTGSADGAGDVAEFNHPMRLVYSAPDLYVADTYNGTIRLIK